MCMFICTFTNLNTNAGEINVKDFPALPAVTH